jgi:FixJ family two-component response regulator
MTSPIPVVHVVDDDDSFRMAVTSLLQAAGYEVRDYSSVGDFLLARPGNAPGCVVLDVYMPGPSGLDLQTALAGQDDTLPIVFVTAHGDIPMSVQAMKAGAVDFLTKPFKRETLLSAVRNALALDAENRMARDGLGIVRSRFDRLSSRERAVLSLVVAGKLNKQIAAELGITVRTVKAHRGHVMAKMQVTSLAELIHVAGQIDLGQSS